MYKQKAKRSAPMEGMVESEKVNDWKRATITLHSKGKKDE